MDKLDELKAIAVRFESHEVKPMPVYPEDILAIAEAFRELEQRAEAAEAQLAELEKQEPHAFGNKWADMKAESRNFSGSIFNNAWGDYTKPLFTRPAPAAVPVDAKVLEDIAIVAHYGGLANLDAANALKLIIGVTLPYFNPSITDEEVLRRIEELK